MEKKDLKNTVEEAREYYNLPSSEKYKRAKSEFEKVLGLKIERVAKTAKHFHSRLLKQRYATPQGLLCCACLLLASYTVFMHQWGFTVFWVTLAGLNGALALFLNGAAHSTETVIKGFYPLCKEEKGAKWLRASEVLAILEKHKKNISLQAIGKALTKTCIKIHKRYLVLCIL